MTGEELHELRIKKGISKDRLAELIGVHPKTIYNYESGGNIPNSKMAILRSVLKGYTKSGNDSLEVNEPSSNKKITIPYYNVDIMATPVEVFNDQTINPEYEISLPGFTDCEFAINIYGDSMYPTYRSGSIVLCRRVNDKNIILWGEAYLVVTEDYRVLKRIERSSREGYILLTSDNYHAKDEDRVRYQPIEIKLDDIRHLFIVKGTLNRQQI